MSDILLPYPSRDLSPNARVHYHAKGHAVKKHRDWARLATLAAGYRSWPHDGPVRVTIHAYPGSKRARDTDNLVSSCKAYLDGIADALGVNDSRFAPAVQWGEPVKDARLVIVLSVPVVASIGELVAPILERAVAKDAA